MRFILSSLLVFFCLTLSADDDLITMAYERYSAGEFAEKPALRSQKFNEALKLYFQAEDSYQPNGLLYYNIGNCFYQLEEYPLAIFYYCKALKILPRNDTIHKNLIMAQKKAGVPQSNLSIFSYKEEARALLFCFTTFIIFSSLSIWQKKRLLSAASLLSGLLFTIILIVFVSTHYISPPHAIILSASRPGNKAGNSSARPLLPGEMVGIIEITADKMSVKITSSDGITGYIPIHSIKIL